MAQIQVTKIIDGPRNGVFHIAVAGDGSGDLVDEVVIDPTTSFDPALPANPTMRVMGLWYDLTGFDAWLEFDYLASDTPVWSMSGGQANKLDFECFGGLADRSLELDARGKLKLSTAGLGNGDRGSLVVKIAKKG